MEKKIPDISGPPSHQPFAFYDPASSSVRTSQATLLSDSTLSSPTLPAWGSMCGGALYELPTPGHLTSGQDCFGLLSTPTTQDAANTAGPSQLARNTIPLNGQVTLLPTPAVNDMGAGKTPEQWDSWTDEMRERHGNGNGHGRSLSIEAQRLLPTPTTDDASNTTRASGDFLSLARTLHGVHTSLRSEGGSSSTEPPPGQLTIEAAWSRGS